MIKLTLSKDGNGLSLDTIPFSDHIDVRVLSANTEETHTVPANANYVIFSLTTNTYVRNNATVIVPAGDITDGTGGDLNPSARSVTPGDVLHLISPAASVVTMAFYG